MGVGIIRKVNFPEPVQVLIVILSGETGSRMRARFGVEEPALSEAEGIPTRYANADGFWGPRHHVRTP